MRSSLEFRGPLLIWVVMAFITLSLLAAALILAVRTVWTTG